jgi:hypothetical protein
LCSLFKGPLGDEITTAVINKYGAIHGDNSAQCHFVHPKSHVNLGSNLGRSCCKSETDLLRSVSRSFLTAVARVRAPVRSRGIRGGQLGIGAGFPCQAFHRPLHTHHPGPMAVDVPAGLGSLPPRETKKQEKKTSRDTPWRTTKSRLSKGRVALRNDGSW